MKKIIVLTSFLTLVSPLLQAEERTNAPQGWHGSIGVMSLSSPEYSGGRNHNTNLLPTFEIKYKDTFFASLFDGVGYNIVNNGTWRAGPIAKMNFGRDADDATELSGLGDIDPTAEVGAFVENTNGKFKTNVEVRQALGGHEGLVAEAGVKYQDRIGSTIISVGPNLTYGDSDYMNAFYGVSTAQAARSAYQAKEADAGFASYGVSGVAIHPLNDRWVLTGFLSYERLAEDAKESAITQDADQMTFGLGVGYRF